MMQVRRSILTRNKLNLVLAITIHENILVLAITTHENILVLATEVQICGHKRNKQIY